MSAAAGWYADPTDAASVRFWDGSAWTAHTRPAPRALSESTPTTSTAATAPAGGITVSDGIIDAGVSAPATVPGAPSTPAGGLLFTATAAAADSDLAARVVSAPAAAPVAAPATPAAPTATPVPTPPPAPAAASPAPAVEPAPQPAPTPAAAAPTPAPAPVPAPDIAPAVEPPAVTPVPAVAAVEVAPPAPAPVAVVEPVAVRVADAPVSNASILATVDDSVPIPTLAPAPVATRVVVSPSVVAPEHDLAPAPVPAPVPAPAAAVTGYAPAAQHGGGSVALLERPAESYADTIPTAAPSQFGGAATPTVFGGAPAKGFGGQQGGFGTFSGDGAQAAAYRPERHLGRTLLILGLVLAAIAGAAVIGVPRYLDGKAAASAAEQPNVLTHSAPTSLAGLRRMNAQAAQNNAVAAAMKSSGSAWAWAATYGSKANAVAYVAFDIPVAQRPQAYRAISNHGQAVALVTELGTKIGTASGGSELLGQATEFASPVGGKVWCMPVTISGSSGGMCLWTNGKEGLASVALPGVMDSAAKSTLVALGQLGKLSTRR